MSMLLHCDECGTERWFDVSEYSEDELVIECPVCGAKRVYVHED